MIDMSIHLMKIKHSFHYEVLNLRHRRVLEGTFGSTSRIVGKYEIPPDKNRREVSEKLLCDGCIPLRELYLFSHKVVFEHCSWKTEKVIFRSALKTMAKSEIC